MQKRLQLENYCRKVAVRNLKRLKKTILFSKASGKKSKIHRNKHILQGERLIHQKQNTAKRNQRYTLSRKTSLTHEL